MYFDRRAQQCPGVTFHRNNLSIVFTSNSFAAALKKSPPPLAAAPIVRVLENSPSNVTPSKSPPCLSYPSSQLGKPFQSVTRPECRPHHSSASQGACRKRVKHSHPLFASTQDWLLTRPARPPRVSAPASFHVVCSLISSCAEGNSSDDIIACGTPPDSTNDIITFPDNLTGDIPPASTSDIIVDGTSPDSTSDVNASGTSSYSTSDSGNFPSSTEMSTFSSRSSAMNLRGGLEAQEERMA